MMTIEDAAFDCMARKLEHISTAQDTIMRMQHAHDEQLAAISTALLAITEELQRVRTRLKTVESHSWKEFRHV